jgi:hypothetical protein
MKPWILVIAALVLGLAVGWGITWSEFAGANSIHPGEARAPNDGHQYQISQADQREFPVAVVEGMEREGTAYVHAFGSIEMGKTGQHKFVIRNEGTAPLTLKKGHFTCTCTIAQLKDEQEQIEILPGESTEVELTWTPKDLSEYFMTEGDLLTNDPANSTLHFVIRGRIVRAVAVYPTELVLDGISASETRVAAFTIYDFHGGPLGVKEYRLAKADTAQYFDVHYETVSAGEIAKEKGAKGGIQFTVTLKPGLPLGPLNQRIHITVDREGVEEMIVPIQGRVVGDVTFIGPGYDASLGYLKLGTVDAASGDSRTLHVMVKGPRRHEMNLKIARIRPDGILQAELGEPRSINDGAVVMIPLEIKVPPGSPAADHLGNPPGSMGLIELESSGEKKERVLVYVSFLVDNTK